MIAGTGVASADTVSADTISSETASFTRSISSDDFSGNSIRNGSEVTVQINLSRTLWWLVYWMKDYHPECFDVVPNSSEWVVDGQKFANFQKSGYTLINDEFTSGPGWAMLDAAGANSWQATPMVWQQKYTLNNCAVGILETGGLEWHTTLARNPEKYATAGPSIRILAALPSGDGGDDGGTGGGGTGGTDDGPLGSLSSIFGSLA